jgi:hypothetical protein
MQVFRIVMLSSRLIYSQRFDEMHRLRLLCSRAKEVAFLHFEHEGCRFLQTSGIDNPATHPNNPATQPNNPATQPNNPTTQPNNPATQPNNPATQPNNPATQPNNPATQPNNPEDPKPYSYTWNGKYAK